MHQELMYQQYVSSKAKERNTQLEQYYEQIITRSQTEMNGKYYNYEICLHAFFSQRLSIPNKDFKR